MLTTAPCAGPGLEAEKPMEFRGRKGIRVSLPAWYHEPNADEDKLEQEEKCKKRLWPWGFGSA